MVYCMFVVHVFILLVGVVGVAVLEPLNPNYDLTQYSM
jgi:hypothetical protein